MIPSSECSVDKAEDHKVKKYLIMQKSKVTSVIMEVYGQVLYNLNYHNMLCCKC